jgi:NTE family protein
MITQDGKSVSLVLGSGGARGLAHIGIIHWLEEHGYRIESIAGCSMGALVGGIYAAGRLDDYELWVRDIDRMGIFSLLDFSFGRGGLFKGERLIATLKSLVGEMRIEELPISFTAVTADIVREREVWLNRGPLFDAIRASISMPLFFTPVRHNGITLIDGSVFNPVPIAPTYHDLTDLTIAVNLNGPPLQVHEEPREEAQTESAGTFGDKVRHFFAGLKGEKTDDHDQDQDWDMLYVVNQSIDAMQGMIARQKLAAHPPDALISIPRNACGTLEYDRATEMIALGYRAAEEQMAGQL